MSNFYIIRGGSWIDNRDGARAADRYYARPDSRYDYLGFRVLCTSKEASPYQKICSGNRYDLDPDGCRHDLGFRIICYPIVNNKL